MLIYVGTKEVRGETLKAVVEGPGPQMLVEILLGMTLSVGHGEISATLDMVAEEHGLTFAARSKEPHPKFEGKIKWGARRGEIFRTFDQIEKMMGGCLKPSKEQRAQFREMLRKEVMEPLRERYNLLKPEFRELQMLVTKPPTEEVKQDKHPLGRPERTARHIIVMQALASFGLPQHKARSTGRAFSYTKKAPLQALFSLQISYYQAK